MTDYVKNVLLGLLTFVTVSLVVAFINTNSAGAAGANDTQLIQLAREVALEAHPPQPSILSNGEMIPITITKVRLTTDREFGIVTFNQAGEEYIEIILFTEEMITF